jgi:hypothetical protein
MFTDSVGFHGPGSMQAGQYTPVQDSSAAKTGAGWRRRLRNASGSAMVAATVSSGVTSIMIAGFMTYLSNEYKLNTRSHAWTQAIHLAEAAVEIGFAELNYQYFHGENGFQSSRGWVDGGGGTHTKTVTDYTDTSGNVVGNLVVTVSGVGTPNPQILGAGTVAGNWAQSISRGVRVTTYPSTRYPVGLMSRQRIDLNGNNIYTDSFDSSDPAKSTNGLYDPAKRQPNGDIASNDVLINTVNIGNADVYGRVSTGPGGTVAMGPNGSVGATFDPDERATTVAEGQAKGWIRDDFDVDVPDTTLPAGADSWYSVGQVSNTTTITSGDWQASSINLNGNKTLTIQGTVRLYVTGSVSVGGNATILLAPGSKLELYAAGNVSVAGNGVVNSTGLSPHNQWYGLPGSTSWNISGNGQWIGAIYAPQAAFRMNGGGSAGDMSGAVVANSITLVGHVRFHYDEYLAVHDQGAGYLVGSWQAMRYGNGVWTPE